jgi:eukaryotic-like serine/threonine-protein kinase
MQTGDLLGPYLVLGKLGEGGMGAVYRARDTRLGRDVALKLLPETFANDPDRVARFAREAQVLAALNHPHVATIYGLEPLAAHQVIVMELVEGETLEARLARGPLDVEHVRRIGVQIADALDAAHERGIVHRDLKPSNVVVRPDGAVKVLDFGLAKTEDASKLPSGISASPTITSGPATHSGMILGTAPYMSPEQARGLVVDRRTDIWALGCLLFESLTGRRAFHGPTLSDTVALILTGEPTWAAIPASVHPSVIALIRRCLRKDTRHRMQSAGDVRLELEELENPEAVAGAPTRKPTPWLLLGGAAVLFVGAVAMFVLANSMPEVVAPAAPIRASVQLPQLGPLWFENGVSLALSRDGRTFAWIGGTGSGRRVWVRAMDQLDGRPLEGTEDASTPFFSPDGEWLGFFTATALKKVKVSGGGPVAIADVSDRGHGGAWGDDGSIIFAAGIDSPLRRIPTEGGEAAPITQLPSGDGPLHRFPLWLPGRQVLLSTVGHAGTSKLANRTAIAAVDLASGTEKIVLEDAGQPGMLATGDLVFIRDNSLYVIEFDAGALSTRGEPKIVVPAVQFNSSSRAAQYAVGGARLIYMAGPGTARESEGVVEWRGVAGEARLLLAEPDTYRDIRFSPEGRRLAYSVFPRDAAATDMWVYDLERDVKNRLASGPKAEWRPVWSQDGRFIVYSDYPGGLRRTRADGTGRPEELTTTESTVMQVPVSVSSDGKYVAYHENQQKRPADVWILPLDPLDAPFRFFESDANDTLPMFSPDGRWIAYVSDESGADELYIRPFPNADAKWRVSSSGTLDEHAWSHDGTRLFFRSGDGQHLMAAPIAVKGDTIQIGRTVSVVSLRPEDYPELGFWGGMSASPDDRGFALVKYAERVVGDRGHLVMMLDWIDAVKRGG